MEGGDSTELVEVVVDAEEGEISDSASVEEISEEVFKNKQVPPSPPPTKAQPPLKNTNNRENGRTNCLSQNSGARVLQIRDLHKYQIAKRTYNGGLYNLAWAQAVNNKPLDEAFVMMEDNSLSTENNKVVIDLEDDGEKEEGELEEGEIDLEFDGDAMKTDGNLDEGVDIQKRIDSIKEEIKNLNVFDEEKPFDRVCSSVKNSADTLHQLVSESSFAEKDNLVELLLLAIKNVHAVFFSMNLRIKEQDKDIFSRLLAHVTSLKPPLFSSQQLKEIVFITSSVESFPVPSSNDSTNKKKEVSDGCSKTQANVSFASTRSLDQTQSSLAVENLKTGFVNLKHKGLILPLLDLHKDHDADSLPSPTQETSPPLPFDKGFVLGQGSVKPEWPVPGKNLVRENSTMHPYETDAVKAVSTYQQKFGQSSFFMNDDLPSPTPSEEGDTGGGDVNGEVSSSTIRNFSFSNNSMFGKPVISSVNSSIFAQPIVSTSASMSATSSQGLSNIRISSAPTITITPPNPVLKSSSARSRDPRLRAANFDGPAMKRQRNESTVVSTSCMTSTVTTKGNGTLQNFGHNATIPITSGSTTVPVITSPNLPLTSQSTNLQAAGSNSTTSLESLLRDIAVNPTIWMDLLKTEQQKSLDNIKSTQKLNVDFVVGAVAPGNGAPSSSSMPVQDESVKVRMKPRDPRRVHYNIAHMKSATSSGSDQLKKQEVQSEKKPISSGSTTAPPDISKQFTNNLRNIADILSVSQASVSPPVVPQIPLSSQSVQLQEGVIKENKGVGSVNLKNGTRLASDEAVSDPPRPPNAWNNVEHLFEGFDDQQKAAIQRERMRRIEEQKKMFANRKLCLVLDLDHTLLNSAKFVEVDPAHDEILRKKEEEDREKPYKHLFRFPHMGMWTKLRPGIWNFLEKASKLYEMHLYTMGNKSYATEMAKLLDPKGELFSGRVLSRGDDVDTVDSDDRVPKIKDLEGVLGMESAVVIIDDSVRVWPHNKLNLIAVERYIYFPCSRRQFGLPGPSLLEIDHDERPEYGTLACSLSVIERIHQNFFSHQSLDEADVRNILASEQRKILSGCRIVFSRVFPVGDSKPHMHPLWQAAQQFGAVCTNQIDDQVTHVVANSLGTDKVNWALSKGKFVVHPGWVEASTLLYRRANEHDFAIKQQ